VCPAVILANKRIDKLNTLAKYDTISTYTKSGRIKNGAPDGINRQKKFNPCNLTARILKPTKKTDDSASVTIIWLVIVKKYGTSPKILDKSTSINDTQI